MTFNLNYVGFYSEGQPNDKALNLSQNIPIVMEKIQNSFDNIIFYTPKKLRDMGLRQYVKEYRSKGCANKNPGLEKIGFCAWRPKILLLELEKMNDGDILVYKDTNILKYTNLYDGFENVDVMKNKFENILNVCGFDFFVPRWDNKLKTLQCCKHRVLRELGNDDRFVYEFPLLGSFFILIKKSHYSIELIEEWLRACENEKWIMGDYEKNHEGFCWYTPEQALLCVIIAKWVKRGKLPKTYPNLIISRDIDNQQIPTNYEYLQYL